MKNILLEQEDMYREGQKIRFTEEERKLDIAFWKRKMGYEPPEQYLPADFSRTSPALAPSRTTRSYSLPAAIRQSIETYAKQAQVSSFLVLLTVLKMLMHRYNAEDEIRVAALLSGTISELAPMANPVIVQSFWTGEKSLDKAVREVQEAFAEAREHQSIPLDELASLLGLSQSAGSVPMFRVMLDMSSYGENLTEGNLLAKRDDGWHGDALADLTFRIVESEEEMTLAITYATDLFREETINRVAGHYFKLLEGALADPAARLFTLPILTDAERKQLLVDWNTAKPAYPRDASMVDLFEEQVKLGPDQIALLFEDQGISYQQLDRRANEIAHRLRSQGIAPEQLVAVCLDRSPDMIASYLGVLKAGGAYVPIDLTYPSERIAYMLEDSAASFVITTERIFADLPRLNATMVFLDQDSLEAKSKADSFPRSSSAAHLAYVMYTSGSTGKPKGVMIDHRGIVRLVKNIDYASVGPDETYMNLGAVAFDVSAFEIYGALLNGGRLVILSTNKPSFGEIAQTIQRYRVTSLNVTPDRLNVLLEDYSEALVGLRQVMPGGEALPVWLARKCLMKLPNCRLINLYGPTENAVNTTSYHVKEIAQNETTIPIGRPIATDRLYILDSQLQPVPIGVIGDLYMAGDGVARGYLNRPELTEERFPLDPFSPKAGERMYKSGDLARYRADGHVDFIGRADDQVKIRGCRIELGEIDSVVGLFPGVRQSVAGVTKGKDGTTGLVSYVVMNAGASFEQQAIRAFVRDKLPEYMIPTFFVELQEVPVTPVGKIDRKRLPVPTVASNEAHFTAPRNQIEDTLVQIWEQLLDVKPISVTDNFFHLGGNSLLAMRMFSYMEKTFQKRLAVSSVFQEDTIEKLAKLLASDEDHAELSKSLVPISPVGTKPPYFCIHGGGGEVLIYGELARCLGQDQPLYGLRYVAGAPEVSVESIARKYIHELREVQPKGPYHLIGFCLGGAIAYEMAQQLLQAGEEIELLAILNYASPALPPLTMQDKIINSFKLLFRLPSELRKPFVMQKLRFVGKVLKKSVDESSPEDDNVQELVSATRSYRPKPYPGKLLLIRAVTNLNPAERLGWQTSPTGLIEEHCMEADHAMILKEPQVGVLRGHLRTHLQRKE